MARLVLRSGSQIGILDKGLVGPDMERGGHYYVSLGEICGFKKKMVQIGVPNVEIRSYWFAQIKS